MDNRVKLSVLGISYNPVQNGAFALILAEDDGPMRIPVIIGAPEAQAIAIKMEGVHPPRPLTHDLFCSFAHAFGVRLREVFIYKFEDGIFFSEMTFSDGDTQVVLDARTSDAVAIAMRTGAPVFTTREIVEQTGIIINTGDDSNTGSDDNNTRDCADAESYLAEPKRENLAIPELEKLMARLIEEEKYEEAAQVSAILNAKRKRRDT